MKSHDEFRRTVFEKARLYELRRKARRRRIAGNLCLFGIVFTILTTATLHVYRSFSASNSKGPDKNAAAFDTSGTMTAASTDRPSSTAASTAGTTSGDTQSPVCRTVFSQVSPSYANGGSPGALFIRADAQWEEFLSVYASVYPGLSEFADTVRTQELSASPLIAVLYTGKPGAEAVFSDAHRTEKLPHDRGNKNHRPRLGPLPPHRIKKRATQAGSCSPIVFFLVSKQCKTARLIWRNFL